MHSIQSDGRNYYSHEKVPPPTYSTCTWLIFKKNGSVVGVAVGTQKHVRHSRRPGHKRPHADPARPPPPAWVTSPHPMTRTLTSRVEVAPGQPINTFSLPLASEPLFIRHPRASNKLVVVTGLYIFTTHQFLGRCKTPIHPTEPRGGQYNVSNIPPPQRDSDS